jgi:UDP-3-O-[3-hydroxymyristoyl] glucosamine N-acyltransferase
MRLTVAEIVARLGGQAVGDAALTIDRIATLAVAEPSHISFLANPRYRGQLGSTRAGCVIVAPAFAEEAATRGCAIVTPDPYLYYARLSQWWAQEGAEQTGVHPSAVVEPSARVAADACIGALSYIGAGAVIGAGTRIAARVTVGARCVIGARGIVHSGAVIGADGFGFAHAADGHWEKIEQLGAVRIGDDVEIGANSCIDRGALDDTVLADGVKLDNLVQIGHNVQVGAHTAMAGCVGVAGSARIGAHCTLGGGAIVLGHLELVDRVHVSAATVVTRSILKPGTYSGVFPFDDNAAWEKNAATLRQLHALRDRLRALEKKA